MPAAAPGLHLNRYDGRPLLDGVRRENVVVERGEAIIELRLGDDEFSISFPAPAGDFDVAYLELAKDVLEHLAEFDNQVQTHCAEECAQAGVPGFGTELAYAMLRPNAVLLRYWTLAMNTEWDEVFTRAEGKWAYSGVGPPDFHERVR
jgi:hypothetical protein